MTSTEAQKSSAAEADESIPKRKGSTPKGAKQPPEVWARAYGLMPMIRQIDGTRQPRPAWEHACADVLHGWAVHAYHQAGPIMLTESDYLAAIEAVKRGMVLCKDGKYSYVPHPRAMSPDCPHYKNYPGKCPPEPVKE